MNLQSARPPDLLRERREALGITELPPQITSTEQLLLRGALVGGGLLVLVMALAAFLFLRSQAVRGELDRLSAIEAQVQVLENQVNGRRGEVEKIASVNRELVKGLVGVRSGSTVLRDLQLRTPEGVQLSQVLVEGNILKLKGVARDPQAFARINALQLDLKQSPLFVPSSVALSRAFRGDNENQPARIATVSFEMQAAFATVPPAMQLRLLQQLGADGMARRYQLLQREGLLP